MDALARALRDALELGPALVVPLAVLAFGLALRLGLRRSLRAAITVGAGLVAVRVVLALLVDVVGPGAVAMADALGVQLDALDVGWPVAAMATFGSPWRS